jgi:peroxiredoxin Q/BCP
MLRPGSPAPVLTLTDHRGRPYTLSDAWHNGPAVLFFYPKAGSMVCTREACAFRDAHADLLGMNATVVGISRDGEEAQQAFAKKWQLPFTLLCDTEDKTHRAYDVDRVLGLLSERITYVIDQSGVVRHAYSGLLDAQRHVQEALDALSAQRNA